MTWDATPDYDGHGPILADLDEAAPGQLAELIEEAWRHRAPARPQAAFDSSRNG